MSKIVFLSIFLIGSILVSGIYLYRSSKMGLISPFAGFYDDHSGLVNKKIAPRLNLDFSKSTTLPVLEKVPRYLVYNSSTGKVYYSKNTSEYFSPASFTKLLTAQVALDIASLDTTITATAQSVNKVPTILGIKPGEIFSLSELLRGSISTSANDAAQTLADGSAASAGLTTNDFIHLMNKKVEFLGLTHTQFANPDGLDDPKQFSTLEDFVQIVHNATQNYPEIIAAGLADRQDIATTSAHGHYYLPNWNGLLGVYPGVNGLKIAYTEGAGYSTIVTFKEDEINLVAIVSGTQSYIERDMAAASLLDAALIAEKHSPKNITKTQINRHYKVWGDLARQIKAELATQEKNVTSSNF